MPDAPTVRPMDPTRGHSPVAAPLGEEAPVELNTTRNTCISNGETYSEGAQVNRQPHRRVQFQPAGQAGLTIACRIHALVAQTGKIYGFSCG